MLLRALSDLEPLAASLLHCAVGARALVRIYRVIVKLETSLASLLAVPLPLTSRSWGILLLYEGAIIDAEDGVNEVPASVSAKP